jgi:hypothetical protein
MRIGKPHLFRITRDADFEIREDEAGDLMRTMQQHVRRRRFGHPARLEVATSMPAEMSEDLTTSLMLTPNDVYQIDGPLNIPDLMQLHGMDRPELKDKPLHLTVPPELTQNGSVFAGIRRQDAVTSSLHGLQHRQIHPRRRRTKMFATDLFVSHRAQLAHCSTIDAVDAVSPPQTGRLVLMRKATSSGQ